jgi:hypothetical protein
MPFNMFDVPEERKYNVTLSGLFALMIVCYNHISHPGLESRRDEMIVEHNHPVCIGNPEGVILLSLISGINVGG